jgi:CMP-N,N'-diacetyllegionaminic acid synthase
MSKNIILLTGRAGSKSIPGKNVAPVLGRPLAYYPMHAAKQSLFADAIYVSTDCLKIQRLAQGMDIQVINRPPHLSRDDSELVDAITHAVAVIDENINYLITMHCNCGTHRPGLVDEAVQQLNKNPEADSCVTGYIDRSVHPFRTKQINADGFLSPWNTIPAGTSSNRQNLTPCFVLDGAVRVMRYANCFPPNGPPPFTYLGNKILYLENTSGSDVHSLQDIASTECLLRELGWVDAKT